MLVTKRDGSQESLDINKIHKVLDYACDGIDSVSPSDVEIKAKLILFDGIRTDDIQKTLVKAASQLIEQDFNYQYVAGRLLTYHIYKQAYRGKVPRDLDSQIKAGVSKGLYSSHLLDSYSEKELKELDTFIRHEKDVERPICSVGQLNAKYIIKDRATGHAIETPSMAYMLMSMTGFRNIKKDRLERIISFYNNINEHVISLPTPIMARCRTPQEQFSSCVVVDCGDSIDSIGATVETILKYVSNLAGMGINMGRIRAVNSQIQNGLKTHTGAANFIRLMESAVNCCNSGGVRKGSGTVNYPIWHYEVEDLLVLRNDEGTPENRIRKLDYCVHLNKYLLQRYIDYKDITLFSPNDVPDLYEAFYSKDESLFGKLYEQYEKDDSIRKKTINSHDLIHLAMDERKKTHRIYFMFADNVNQHSSFVDSIYMTNLCVEITLPTKPIVKFNTNKGGLVGLCTLAALNVGIVAKKDDLRVAAEDTVYYLNEILNNQLYLTKEAKEHTQHYRPLGVGIINLAYLLAKNNVKYGEEEALQLVHEWMEEFSYDLIEASLKYSIETGKVAKGTLYSQGILPIDTYNRNVDDLVKPVYKKDWEGLRRRIIANGGIANGCLMAQMPAETSAQACNAVNGPELALQIITFKKSGNILTPQVLPDAETLMSQYDYRNNHASPRAYLKTMAVMQKFMDQAISVNTSYNKQLFPENKIPLSVMVDDLLFSQKYGIKTWYYLNSNDGNTKQEMVVEEKTTECEACTL